MSKDDMSSPMETEDINIPLNDSEMVSESSNSCSILDLPPEIITKIFSYLPSHDLWKARGVCRRFKGISAWSQLWKDVHIDEGLTLNDAIAMLTTAGPYCKNLILENRIDTNKLLHWVSKLTRNVQTIKINKCKGSVASEFLKGTELCNLATRLKRLRCFSIYCTRFRSCKFFEIIARRRSNVYPNFEFPVIYTGPVNSQQILVHFQTAYENDEEEKRVIKEGYQRPGSGFMTGRMVDDDKEQPYIEYEIHWTPKYT